MKKESQPLEISDDESIEVHTNYAIDNPLYIEDEDPSKRYFFAANDGDKSRPDGIARVEQLGYRKSEKKHGSTDCVLMEIPRAIWDAREKKKREARDQAYANAESQLEREAGDNVVKLDKDGGYRR
jgi:hypothetical protein